MRLLGEIRLYKILKTFHFLKMAKKNVMYSSREEQRPGKL